MAASVHDNIRLDVQLTGVLPTNTYDVATKGHHELPYAVATSEISLDGTLQVHRIMDGSDPTQDKNYAYELVVTQAEKAQLEADVGRVAYLMQNYRDDADVATYRKVVFFQEITDVHPLDPMLNYYSLAIRLVGATGLTVG